MRKRVVFSDAAPQPATCANRAGVPTCVFPPLVQPDPSFSSSPSPASAPGARARSLPFESTTLWFSRTCRMIWPEKSASLSGSCFRDVAHASARPVLVLLVTLSLLTALNAVSASPAAAADTDAIRSAHGRMILAQGRGRPGPPGRRCLSRQEQRARIATKAVVPLSKLARAVKARGGELLRARLCQRNGGLVYLLTVLGPGGKVRRSVVNARTGAVIRGPR